ncbi:clotting factor B-like isoform X3 [Panulirus ornatus]|uniref:clotting factor B-like isoform X3 n=1 Tax=Panulirus ornatus TaxID=150431 RepID=UPI003A8554FA
MSGVRGVSWSAAVVMVVCCTTTHTHTRGGCEDHVIMCERWAATGWCLTRPQYMQENCRVSCNLCGGGGCDDKVAMCGRWAATGWCLTRPQYMQENCRVSCNLCGGPECVDRRAECAAWAKQGACATQREQMVATCPRSCDACDQTAFLVDVRVFNTSDRPPGSTADVPGRPVVPGTQVQTITNPGFVCGQGYPPAGGVINSGTRTAQDATGDKSGVLMMIPGKVNMMLETRFNKLSVHDTFCGATPITDRFLLTAAHCAIDPKQPVRTVRLGELDFAKDNEENSRPVDYEVEKVIIHPEFIPASAVRYNDVALIQTVKPMAFNEVVFPYCLSVQRPPPKTIVTTAGFGLYNATYRSSRLKEKELELVDPGACEETYRRSDLEDHLKLRYPQLLQGSDVMCAAHPKRDACEGDSGGPLFIDKDGRRFLVGVVGSGVSCRGNGISILPGLYISVADHIDFIDSVVYGITKK